jgi:hypothetical protein
VVNSGVRASGSGEKNGYRTKPRLTNMAVISPRERLL